MTAETGRIRALEDALRPFADESLHAGPQHGFVTVPVAACDAARAALASSQPAQPLTVQDAARVPEIAALIEKAMNREPSLIWIIENTSQVRVRDLALDILTQQREILRAIAEGRA